MEIYFSIFGFKSTQSYYYCANHNEPINTANLAQYIPYHIQRAFIGKNAMESESNLGTILNLSWCGYESFWWPFSFLQYCWCYIISQRRICIFPAEYCYFLWFSWPYMYEKLINIVPIRKRFTSAPISLFAVIFVICQHFAFENPGNFVVAKFTSNSNSSDSSLAMFRKCIANQDAFQICSTSSSDYFATLNENAPNQDVQETINQLLTLNNIVPLFFTG